MGDLIKAPVLLAAYLLVGPLLGLWLRGRPRAQDWTFGLLIFLTGLPIDYTVVMLGSIEWYRGVTKGFEFTGMEVLAIALLVARAGQSGFRWWVPATSLWLLYVAASMLSLLSALELSYVWMSLVKFSKVWLLAMAAWNYVRGPHQVQVLLYSLAVLLIYQCFFVLKMKFVDGVYQVRGLFEHQNPLAMFTYFAALPLFSAALAKDTKPWAALFCLGGFAAGGLILVSALSRAALLFFGFGTAWVLGVSLLLGPSLRKLAVAGALGVGAAILLSLTLDTIVSRFNDEGNEASGETRDVMNAAAVAMVQDKPLGTGWNNFAKAINAPYPYGDVIDDWNADRGQPVDPDYPKGVVESHYYLLLGETGYPGYYTYLLFIAVTGGAIGWVALRRWGEVRGALAGGIFITLAITYFHSTLERTLTQTKNLALYLILIGVGLALLRRDWGAKPAAKPVAKAEPRSAPPAAASSD